MKSIITFKNIVKATMMIGAYGWMFPYIKPYLTKDNADMIYTAVTNFIF